MIPEAGQTNVEADKSSSAHAKRRLLPTGAVLIVVVCCGAAALVWKIRSPRHAATPATERDLAESAQPSAQPDMPVQVTNDAPHFAPAGKSTVAQQAATTNSQSPINQRPEPTPLTRQLMNSLCRLDQPSVPQTDEQVFEWKQTFQQLIKQGAVAVPAI